MANRAKEQYVDDNPYQDALDFIREIQAALPVRGMSGVLTNRCALCQHLGRKAQENCVHNRMEEFWKRHEK